MEYIIVQAGGKGTRLGYLTKNKPKTLTPVENLPILFHLFHKYPNKRYVIIADYKSDVLRKYLSVFAEVKYQIVNAMGTGTSSGVKQAVSLIPDNEPFMLVWSDIILSKEFKLPRDYSDISDALPEVNYVGLSATFPCRWKYENGKFAEERSSEFGVVGLFLFQNKKVLRDVPESGEFVRWMKEKNILFETINVAGTREFGLIEEYEKLEQIKTRPFNKITKSGHYLIKEPVDEQGKCLIQRECAWYERAKKYHIQGIPVIYNIDPLTMECIKGRNIYECDFSYEEKKKILESLVITLKELHESDSIQADSFSMKEAYFNKTMNRLSKIEYLVPFAKEKYIRVNGRNCRNVFFFKDRFEKRLEQLKAEKFSFIHGDCTFSNLMIRDSKEPVLIDPRGYFGFTELYGDERYDWAKLYYSIVGNYDQFNLKRFSVDIGKHSIVNGNVLSDLSDDEVRVSIESNGWEKLEKLFFELTGSDEDEIKLLHAVIWLSFTTYAWQDYDSVCGAFYNGLYYLEEVL